MKINNHQHTPETVENLKREIGPGQLAMAIINIVVGSGIFVLPALAAEGLGATAILAYITCGMLIFSIALCFARIGRLTSKSGGAYTYIVEAFGPFAGFLASGIYLTGGCMVADAAIANALTDTLKYFFPALGIGTNRMIFLFILFAGLGLLNIRSLKGGLRFVLFAGYGKIAAMLLLVVLAIPSVKAANLEWVVQPGFANIGAASLILFFAFQGFEVPLCNSGEIKNPSRTVPVGLFIGVLLVLALYISIQVIVQGILGDSLSSHKDAPLSAVAATVIGSEGMVFMLIVTIISMLGSLSGDILSIPRIIFAGARDGLFPKALAMVHSKFATPFKAIILYTVIDFLLAISGGFKQLAMISSATGLMIYLTVVLASIKLSVTRSKTPGSGFQMPVGIVIPLLTVVAILWLLSNLKPIEIGGLAIAIAVLSLIYFIRIFFKRRKLWLENANSGVN